MRIPGRIKLDRIRHVDTTNAHTGPIFLAYRQNQELKALVARVKEEAPLYDFVSEDAIRHRVWMIGARSMVEAVEAALQPYRALYCRRPPQGCLRCEGGA